jgi:hypothetical protein
MSNIAVFDYNEQGWEIINDQEEFLRRYPKPKHGHYRPQPWSEPNKYPCLVQELATIDNPNGADHIFIAYIYDFKPTFKG